MAAATRRPQKGDRFIVSTEFVATVMTTWEAPYTGGTKKQLPKSLPFIIGDDPVPSATAAMALPVPYEQWEPILVPEEDLAHPKYSSYYLAISFDDLAMHCRPITAQDAN
jgi:hypothetical protein